MIELNDLEKEKLRHLALEVLVASFPNALTRRDVLIRIGADVEFDIDQACVEASLEFLKGLQFVDVVHDDFGSTKYWKATAWGIRALERENDKRVPKRD